MSERNNVCRNCRHFSPNDKEGAMGQCRRHPRQFNPVWPLLVVAYQGCDRQPSEFIQPFGRVPFDRDVFEEADAAASEDGPAWLYPLQYADDWCGEFESRKDVS